MQAMKQQPQEDEILIAEYDSNNLVIGCVAENTPRYLSQALRLVQSVRWFGGEMAVARFIVCVVGEVDVSYRDSFEQYSAEVRTVDRFSVKHPQSNKIRFLQQSDLKQYKHVLLLDCDTIVVQDPTPHLKCEGFCAKIADGPTIAKNLFVKLFDFFKLPLPKEEYACTVRGTATIPYFNAGVLLFSQSAMSSLVPVWIRLNQHLIQNIEVLESSSNFCEQASLSLAVVASGTRFDLFGNEMNFPIHHKDYIPSLAGIDPLLIHYHSLIDQAGYLEPSQYAPANIRIAQFNERLRKERGISSIC